MLSRKVLMILLTKICFILFFNGVALSYGDKLSHPELTKEAINQSQLVSFLIQLGFTNGTKQVLKNNNYTKMSEEGRTKTIIEWLVAGSEFEDIGTRASYHFYFQDTGPWMIDITEYDPNQYRLSIREAGTYFLTANAWDSAGNLYSDTVAIRIMDTAMLDAMLREKWEGMKTSLAAGDIQGAMAYFTYPSQEKYTKIFTAIGENLPEFVSNMEDIGNVYMRDRVAKYRIKRDQEVNGQIYKITLLYILRQGL